MYDPEQLRRLAFIQAGQRLGMTLDDIAAFLDGSPHQWRGIVRSQIASLEAQIRHAETARDYLTHALQCPSEHPVDQCPHLRRILDQQLGWQARWITDAPSAGHVLAPAGEVHADRPGWAEGDEAAGARQPGAGEIEPVVAAQPG
jgi:DNA-binding transcriptional MerR regulator